jgi:hypothetical protein
MVYGNAKSLAGFATAAREMVEGDLAHGAAGRFSKTIFIASDGRQPFIEDAAIRAAGTAGLAIVVVQFGTGSKARGPRAYTVAGMIDGTQVVERDCALWIGDEGRAVLVPRGKDADGWFEMTDRGFERRPGQRAQSLAAGMIKAANSLVTLAKTSRTDGCIGVSVVEGTTAA